MSFKDFLCEIVNSGVGTFVIGWILGYWFMLILASSKSDTDNKKDLAVDDTVLKNGMSDLEKFSIK